jgi:NADH dehydrogenase FAD-containing subunit
MSTMASRHILVLGGGYAGVLAASRAARRLRGRARVTLVSDRDDLVNRIRLHEALAGAPLRRYPLASLLPRSVHVVRGRATAIRAADHRVVVDGRELAYNVLIVALGSRPAAPRPGVAEHASWLTSPEAAQAGAARLAGLPAGAPVTVIGGGLTAIEAVTEIAERHPHLAVSLVTGALGAGLSAKGRAYLRAVLAELGVVVREGAVVDRVEAGAVVIGDQHLPSALTVWAGGFEAAGAAIDADLSRDDRGRFRIGADLRAAGVADVFIAGDAAAPPPGLPFLRMGCASAMPLGAHAADGAIALVRGGAPQPHRFGFLLQCISLGRRRGLIQRVDARDQPIESIVSGRAGALVKELVCRSVTGSLRLARRWPGVYQWPKGIAALPAGKEVPALPPA